MIRNLSQEPGRATAAIDSLLLVTVVYWPIHHNWSEESADDFPLFSYPMFTSQGGSTTKLYHAVDRTRNGDTVNLPRLLAGAGGMNSVRLLAVAVQRRTHGRSRAGPEPVRQHHSVISYYSIMGN